VRFDDRKGRGRREDGRAVLVLAGEVRDIPHQRACVGRASQLAGLSGWRGEGGSPASLGGIRRDQVRGVHRVFRLLGAAGYMLGIGDSREQQRQSVPTSKRRTVSIPRCFTGHSSSSSRSREGRVDRGFRTDNGSKGEGEVGRFTGVRSRTVDAVVKKEGEDRRDRNERIRSDILGVRLRILFREYVRV
jgi:hypothetical protein